MPGFLGAGWCDALQFKGRSRKQCDSKDMQAECRPGVARMPQGACEWRKLATSRAGIGSAGMGRGRMRRGKQRNAGYKIFCFKSSRFVYGSPVQLAIRINWMASFADEAHGLVRIRTRARAPGKPQQNIIKAKAASPCGSACRPQCARSPCRPSRSARYAVRTSRRSRSHTAWSIRR